MNDNFFKRTWAEINLDFLKYNIDQIRSKLKPECMIMSVVKADAYGHGEEYTAKCLDNCGVDWFGVSNLEEAMILRRQNISKPILIFGFTPPEFAEVLSKNNITQTVFSLEYAQKLSAAASSFKTPIDVHIKLDTGMGRIGFSTAPSAQNYLEKIISACSLPSLSASGIFTHLSCADESSESAVAYTRMQFERFQSTVSLLEKRGIIFEIKHCCNSAGVLHYPEMHLDMVRPGIIQYGLHPSSDDTISLKPVMQLKSVISHVKDVEEGEFISYGRTFITPHPMKIATVAIGYADGYSRSLSNKAYALVHGKKATVIGRVCMDQLMLDVTDIPNVCSGDVITLFGTDQDALLPVEILAEMSDSINYEIVCHIGRRVPRAYFSGGEHIDTVNYLAGGGKIF